MFSLDCLVHFKVILQVWWRDPHCLLLSISGESHYVILHWPPLNFLGWSDLYPLHKVLVLDLSQLQAPIPSPKYHCVDLPSCLLYLFPYTNITPINVPLPKAAVPRRDCQPLCSKQLPLILIVPSHPFIFALCGQWHSQLISNYFNHTAACQYFW